MPGHKCIPLNSPAEWKEALQGINHAFAHTWENCYAMHLTTGQSTFLYCFELEDVRIVCPIAERKFGDYTDIVTPYGFSGFVGSGDCPEFPRYWNEFVRLRKYICGYIALNPIFENDTYFEPRDVYQPNSLYFLDLILRHDELFENLDRNRKRQLRGWKEAAAHFIYDKSTLTNFLVTNYPEFLRRVNASPASFFTNQTLNYLCSRDNVFMVGSVDNGELEAVYVFAYSAHLADCLFNVALPSGRHHTTALLWCGVNHLKSLGVPLLNLGGGVRENDSIAQSKQRFGSRKVPFRCLKQVYNSEIYEVLCHRANSNPDDMTGYFPAYRSARIRQ